ncbi:TasA family protein [Anaerosacchariphilus polymeriproducens]|nr:TasA family protein [Anaerosacchariphilus polymeriproducens]
MNKKRNITLVTTAAALLAVVMIGGTLAYFTDRGEATNVVTFGKVNIELTEPKFEAFTNQTNTVNDVYPGQTIEKDPTITVDEDSSEAYIRAKISYNNQLTKEQQAELERNLNLIEGWTKSSDGYYYYRDIVKPTQSVLLFDKVMIPANWDNAYAEKTFEINIIAEAIQVDNFTPAFSQNKSAVIGWNYVNADGTVVPITPETYQDN